MTALDPTTPSRSPRSTARLRTWIVVALAFALMLYGVTGTLVQSLGALHFHQVASIEPAKRALQDVRRVDAGRMATAAPGHGRLARHHHGADDTTVVAVGDRSGDDAPPDDSASVGVACQIPLPHADRGMQVPAVEVFAWRIVAARAIVDHLADPPERPPRA